jgi:transposase InsO family protein
VPKAGGFKTLAAQSGCVVVFMTIWILSAQGSGQRRRYSQCTGAAFTSVLIDVGVRISMDGRGRWMDNVFIERLRRSLKHENVYLKGHAEESKLERALAKGSPSGISPGTACKGRAGCGAWDLFMSPRNVTDTQISSELSFHRLPGFRKS